MKRFASPRLCTAFASKNVKYFSCATTNKASVLQWKRAYITDINDYTDLPLPEIRSRIKNLDQEKAILTKALLKHSERDKTNILILGAGRSSTACIDYLLEHAKNSGWFIRLGDSDIDNANEKIKEHPCAVAFPYNALNKDQRAEEIAKADVVVSLLPVLFHYDVAKECVKLGKSLVTASYASAQIRSLDKEAKENGVLLMMECGVDPGIDHMSAMQVINRIKSQGGDLRSFQSFTGGLVAPESDDNPWNYKFTWNPRNVVVAGQGVSKFLQNGKYKYIPYNRVFSRIESLKVPGAGVFEGYANRDSLSYIDHYNLHDTPTVFRGTLRKQGFCKAWDIFVQLGMTDDSYVLENSESMTNRDFINSFLVYRPHDSVELKLAYHMKMSIDSPEMQKLKWLGIFEDKKIGLKNATPAQMLQQILEKKFFFKEGDKDMIVMYNHYIYEDTSGDTHETVSSMMTKGDGNEGRKLTAMAKAVGLPLGIVTRLVAEGKIPHTGIQIPTRREIYEPVLAELSNYGISFTQADRVVSSHTLTEYAANLS